MEKELDVFQMYVDEMAAIDACGPEENARLSELAANGDDEARVRLTEGNLRRVLEMSRDYLGKGVAASDLVQEANVALLMAIEEYEPGEGRFEDFLSGKVNEALRAAVEEHRIQSQVSRKVLERVNMLQDVSKQMAEELGREATVPELAEKMKMTEDEVKDIMKVAIDALKVMGE